MVSSVIRVSRLENLAILAGKEASFLTSSSRLFTLTSILVLVIRGSDRML